MSLVIGINQSKHVSEWVDYLDDEAKVLAKFKIRGISYKPYQVAIERARNMIASATEIKQIDVNEKTYAEMLLTCTAYHLIEDWSGIAFPIIDADGNQVLDENEKPMLKDVEYSQENALDILVRGDIGDILWNFINTNAKRIQFNYDKEKAETLGKSKSYTNGSA